MSTIVRAADLRKVFSFDASNNLNPSFIRMSVLFEDLRVEVAGISEDGLGKLDANGEDYRMQYFLRRSLATLNEFADAILWLEFKEPEFAPVKSRFDRLMSRNWCFAVLFFQKFQPLLQKIRNDMGGHFGITAARYVCERMATDTVIVSTISWGEAAPTLRYAQPLAIGPLIRHVPGDDVAERTKFVMRKTIRGYKWAIRAMSVLVSAELFRRFG